MTGRYRCGPLLVAVTSQSEKLGVKVAEQLGLFNVAWDVPPSPVAVDLEVAEPDGAEAKGDYLVCGRMRVDRDASAVRATCTSGLWATWTSDENRWRIGAPRSDDAWILLDLEVLLTLVLTHAWRALGWVPLHAGAVVRDDCCALLCAESGGGKTSLTAAMIRAGWKTLGDDKLLLRTNDAGRPELRALVHTFNLHPKTRRWFPEVGDLERLPTYSLWTEKRKVDPEDIWPGTTVDRAMPTHLIQLLRRPEGTGLVADAMGPGETLSTLLHQTVIPNRPACAKPILREIARATRSLRGIRVAIGDDAFAQSDALEPLLGELR